MLLSVDSSVILAIVKDEQGGAAWLDFILQLGREARLSVCEVVYAELSALVESEEKLQSRLRELGLAYDSIQPTTAFIAGQRFAEYRRAGGPRRNLIPDFLIGAHGLGQANGLLTADRGYLRNYFRGLKILEPKRGR
ncbi:MAG: type II toxin-antitoxin system VapC family toxin [Chthoniobacterales bacterium]